MEPGEFKLHYHAQTTLLTILGVVALALMILLFLAQPVRAQTPVDFAGLGFGVGFAFDDSLTADLVAPEDVSVVDDILRVSRVSNVSAGLVFESHVTFQAKRWLAVGPYFSITPGADELVKGVGLGLLFELNRPALNPETNRYEAQPVSFNIGIGLNVVFEANVLRPGFINGVHVPDNGQPWITREKAVFQIMSSMGFDFPF